MKKSQSWLSLIPSLQQLLHQGVCKTDNALSKQLLPLLTGIAALSTVSPNANADNEHSDSSLFVASRPLLQLREMLNNDNEAMAAILATVDEIRTPWLNIMAARLKEAGKMEQPERLVQLVSQLEGAAGWVESALPNAKLASSQFSDLERRLFSTVAESAQAIPILCRILAAAAWLHSRRQPLPAIMPVDQTGERPDFNWCKGRLLELPQRQTNEKKSNKNDTLQSYLLSGIFDKEPQSASNQDPLPYVLMNPWLFLLTSIVYTQDSWAAEHRGGLLLELSSGQNPFCPNQIQVLVASNDGDEILCGSLAELILRWLERRQIYLFPSTPKTGELDSQLGLVVQALLAKKIWRYYDGLSGQQGYYGINETFGDLCYRRLGSKIFQRYGKTIWQEFRILAENWAMEVRSGSHTTTIQEGAI